MSDKTEELKIRPSVAPLRRMLGSNVSRRILRLLANDEFPPFEPNGDEEPQPPPIRTVVPDIGFQLRGLSSDFSCPDDDQQESIRTAIENQIQREHADAKVLVNCSSTPGEPFIFSVGVWISPGAASEEDLIKGLQALDILRDMQGSAVFLTSSYIKAEAQRVWNDETPKRWNHDAKEDDRGSVHLTGFTCSLQPPNIVITKITGFDTSTWPDVDFMMTITDRLDADRTSFIKCDTDSNLEVDSSFLFLSGVITLILAGILPSLVFFVQGIKAEGADFEREEGGVGCALAAQIPPAILFEIDPDTGRGKLEFLYTNVEVTSAGLFAGGAWVPVVREPQVFIDGPSSISIPVQQQRTRRTYRVKTVDLREPLAIQWTPGGTGRTQEVEFDTTGLPAGTPLSQQITVHVTDADGLEAQNGISVGIEITGGSDTEPF